jgi:DNA-binding transcriptional LysR family regulator
MMLRLDPGLISYFSAVAKYGSISRAAERLGTSVSTVSRKIDEIERSMGVRLFERDTRHLRLTEAGRDYLYYVDKALQTLELGQQNLDRYQKEISGDLKIWSPPTFGRKFVAHLIAEFGLQHPSLNISLQLEGSKFPLGATDFDVAICVGMPSDGRVVISKLCNSVNSFVATPEFLQRHGVPRSVQDLEPLPVVTVFHEEDMSQRVAVEDQSGQVTLLTSKLIANDATVALKAITSGKYIGKIMQWYAAKPLLEGSLVKVLPQCTDEKSFYIVVQGRKGNPRKVQLFVDFFKQHLQAEMAEIEQQTTQLPYAQA